MRQSQFGKTLIETLSILALIGILCISGLQLYTKLMNAIRSNYLMQQVFVKANELIQNPVMERHRIVDISLMDKEVGRLAHGYSFCASESDCAPKLKDGIVQIQVNGYFPVDLCKILRKKMLNRKYQGLTSIIVDNDPAWVLSSHTTCPEEGDIKSMTFIIDPAYKE